MNSQKLPSRLRKEALFWLYGFLKPHKSGIAKLAGLSLLTTAMVVVQPYITKLIIDEGLLKSDFNALLLFSMALLLLGFLTTLLAAWNRIKHTRLSANVLFALREDVYTHLLKLPPAFYHQQRTGDITSRMDRDVAEIQRFAVDTLFSTFSAVLGLIGAVAMMVYLNWKLSLILLLLVPFELIYLYFMRPKVERRNIAVREKGADISAFFAEKVPAVKFIQSVGTEQQEINKLSALNESFLGRLVALQKTEIWTSAIPASMVSLSRAAIFLVGGYWVIQGSFLPGSLIAFVAYVGMATGPAQSLLGLYLAWQRLTVSLDRVSFLRQQPIPESSQCYQELPDDLKGKISIENLCFSYRPDAVIFDHASLVIPAGCKVGIRGKTGIGKSTFLDLLQKHLQADSGRICIDGFDLATFSPQQWRKKIAVAPQEPVIFRETLANNIRYGNPEASDQEVTAAAEAVGLGELIDKIPHGLNALISERGSFLSGGERQRIGLARAMLLRPVILILDEPTSATDSQMESLIVQQIDELFPDTTRIIVSHRDSALYNADMIVDIEQNKFQLSGSPQCLKPSAEINHG